MYYECVHNILARPKYVLECPQSFQMMSIGEKEVT